MDGINQYRAALQPSRRFHVAGLSVASGPGLTNSSHSVILGLGPKASRVLDSKAK